MNQALALRNAPEKVIRISEAAPGQMALALRTPEGVNLSEEDRAQALRRYKIIEPLVQPDEWRALWAQVRGRKLALIGWLASEHKVPERTLYHWLKRYEQAGLQGLVNRDRSDKGRPRALSGAALDLLLAYSMPRKGAYGELSVREIWRAYNEERAWRAAHAGRRLGDFEVRKYGRWVDEDLKLKPEAQLPEASYDTFLYWFGRIPDVLRVMGREGVEAFANTQEIISYRDFSSIQPMDYVVMDHRLLDLFCLAPERGGVRLMRPWLTAAIDMRTRKWLAWAIVRTPSSDSIATVLKKVFLQHGLPKSVYWDNGRDFRCEWLEGRRTREEAAPATGEMGEAWRGVLDTLGVRVHHAIVRRARAKVIEPAFRATAEYDHSTPWWCGNKPSARPETFEALVAQHERWLAGESPLAAFPTIDQVAGLYTELMETLNERERLHAEGMGKITPTGRGWMGPNECWEKLIPRVERRAVPAEILQFCFARRRRVTVAHGEAPATIDGRKYHYRLVPNAQGLIPYNGAEVELGYDPLDPETVAVYCDERFLGLARDAELRTMGGDRHVEDERDRRATRRDTQAVIEAVRQAVYAPGVVERAARRAEVRPERIEPARVEVEAPVSPAIAAAAEAAAEERRFRFSAAEGAEVPRLAAPAEAGDDEFDFFGGNDGQRTT